MEEVAQENLKDLIERNLISIEKLKINGKPKSCRIHDLVRDLCIKLEKKSFFINRPLSILSNYIEGEFNIMQSMPSNRSFICSADTEFDSKFKYGSELLRLLKPPQFCNDEFVDELTELPNLRWLKVPFIKSTTSISKLWNLQYLFVFEFWENHLPLYIWKMPQLRHLEVPSPSLPPLPGRTEMPVCVLKNLETLFVIENFRCDDEVLLRIPNLRKLKIHYEDDDEASDWSYYRLNNLVKMSKLETLSCEFEGISTETLVANLAFPMSLKKLSLSGCEIPWEHIEIIGPTWETIEDNFKKLEYLMIHWPVDLNEWIVEDANHFPSLRHLVLEGCKDLEEIPTCILDICSDGVVSSAKNIQDDNEIKLIINNTTRHAYDD
ncbi:hypothetical protein ACJIZ3_016664 [Penstemon smallii]|uniref:Disease resistance protein winged helix domain-containing protein n=1 Tax=Penstemon smallii TaxID=265156 RepID=A0ABD3STI0_9LAMI